LPAVKEKVGQVIDLEVDQHADCQGQNHDRADAPVAGRTPAPGRRKQLRRARHRQQHQGGYGKQHIVMGQIVDGPHADRLEREQYQQHKKREQCRDPGRPAPTGLVAPDPHNPERREGEQRNPVFLGPNDQRLHRFG